MSLSISLLPKIETTVRIAGISMVVVYADLVVVMGVWSVLLLVLDGWREKIYFEEGHWGFYILRHRHRLLDVQTHYPPES